MLHAKTAVADGLWARVGSTNLNLASWIGNWELDVAVESERFGQEMQDLYLDDLKRASEIVLGRILGFSAVGTAMLLAMGVISYGFVWRGLRHGHQVEVDSIVEEKDDNGKVVRITGRTTLDAHHRHTFELDAAGKGKTNIAAGHWHQIERLNERLRQDHGDAPALNALAGRRSKILHEARHHRRLVDQAIPQCRQRLQPRVVETDPRWQQLEAFRKIAAHDRAVAHARRAGTWRRGRTRHCHR